MIIYSMVESKRGLVNPEEAGNFYDTPASVTAHLQSEFYDKGTVTFTTHTAQNDLRRVRVFFCQDGQTAAKLLADPVFATDIATNKAYNSSHHIKTQEFDSDPTHNTF